MRLRHEPLEVVDEALAAVLGVLVVPADVDRFLRADFLAVAAEDAAEFVDLEQQRIAVALLVLTRHQLDAVGGADGGAEPARDALGLAVLGREHAVRAAPSLADGLLLLGVLRGHLLLEDVPQRVLHPAEGGTYVARLLDRSLDGLHADGHQSPASESGGAICAVARGAVTARSFARSRRSRRE